MKLEDAIELLENPVTLQLPSMPLMAELTRLTENLKTRINLVTGKLSGQWDNEYVGVYLRERERNK